MANLQDEDGIDETLDECTFLVNIKIQDTKIDERVSRVSKMRIWTIYVRNLGSILGNM